VIGDDGHGPVAESVDARAVHRSLSWFKSRPGLQPSPLVRNSAKREAGKIIQKPVDGVFQTLSRLRNLV